MTEDNSNPSPGSVPSSSKAKGRSWLILAIVWVLAFDVAWLWQRASGAHTSEFGGHPDEAAHFVTGLMVRDYIAAGFPGSPMKFAETYYAHYPKIGLGVWPPVFYAVQSAWTLPFGTGRLSLMHLMAALAATVALLVFAALREECGEPLAALGGLLLLSGPLFRESYGMVMAETLSTVFMFGAALLWGRFLERGKGSSAIWFGLLAGLAIMTKGTGLALALQAPLALAFSGRWQLIKRPALWGGAALTLLVAGPWTWLFRSYGKDKGGWLESSFSAGFVTKAFPYYAGKLGLALGILLLAFLCVGIFTKVVRSKAHGEVWASVFALLLAVLVFQSIMPVGLEARHLVPALPAAVMLVVAGMQAVGARIPRVQTALASGAIWPVCILWIVGGFGIWLADVMNVRPVTKHWSGFSALAREVLRDPSVTGEVLVSSDARGEGMFISELAANEKRPGHVVRRANKDLASMDWAGRHVTTRFSTPDVLIDWLQKGKIDYLVVDTSMPDDKRGVHHDQLKRVVGDNPTIFWPVTRSEVIRGGETAPDPLILYRIRRKEH